MNDAKHPDNMAKRCADNTGAAAAMSAQHPVMQTLPAAEHDRWDAFVAACGAGTLFHTAWWHRAWGMTPTVQVLADSTGNIQAGVCYCVGRRFGTRAIVRPPLTPRNGPVFAMPAAANHYKAITQNKKTMLAVLHGLPKLGLYDFLLRPEDVDVMPFLWNGFDSLAAYTYVIPRTARDVWVAQTAKNMQRNLRKLTGADARPYALDRNPPLEEAWSIVQSSAATKRYTIGGGPRIAPWWQAVVSRSAGRIYLARDAHGRAVACNFLVHDNRTAYNLAVGVAAEQRHGSLAGLFLLDQMIRDAHADGLDFDFEGSMLPGVERFVRSFGGELRRFYRVVKLPSLWANLLWQTYRYWRGHRSTSWVWHE